MAEYKIEGLEAFNEKIRKLSASITPKSLLTGAYVLEKYAKMLAPVDTGFLRSSGESHVTDRGAELVFHANYAVYQEFGDNGTPYVRPALDENSDEILKAIAGDAQSDIESAIG